MYKHIIITALLLLFYSLSHSCTTFLLKTGTSLVFGKNYDFQTGAGLVFVNKRGIEKTSLAAVLPASWKSKYGSVTFNQYGREFPSGGINESGLVIELMWLDGTKYPEPDDRPSVGGILQWIQYQLDNSATVDEIIESDKFIRITQNSVPVHYLTADKNGDCASIEFIDGKLVYHKGETMPFTALTNDTYESSAGFIKKFEEFGGNEKLDPDKSSLGRFANTCRMLKLFSSGNNMNAVDYGFNMLKANDQGEFTKWSIIYDIKNLAVYFRTDENRKIKNIELGSLDYKCMSPVKMININNDNEGNINSMLENYSVETNREIIGEAFSNVDFLKDTPAEVLDKRAQYPETMNCMDKAYIEPSMQSPGNQVLYKGFITALFVIITGVILRKKLKYYLNIKHD
jgi:penicillin V acylase-like amidase (Ntn superfamily)